MSEAINIDLSNYKDRVGARVAEGRYKVLVQDAEQDTAKSGNAMINLWFDIIGGDYDGATIVDRLVLTEKSLFRVVGFMQALGLPTPKKRVALQLRQVIGKTLEIDVEDGEPYMGRVKSEVRGYMRLAKKDQPAAKQDIGDDLDEYEESGQPEKATAAVEAEGDTEDVDLSTVDLG